MATSYAPPAILEVREYLKPITGLDNFGLGIVNSETDASYHHGWSQRDSDGTDYSWQESSRDWSHKTNAARALDIGMFPQLRAFSVWLVAQCEANRRNPAVNVDCADIREIVYSPDGIVVKRWDRLGKRTTGSLSHRTHTHVSWFADAEHKSKIGPFKRFFEGDNMSDGYTQSDRDTATADTYRLAGILSCWPEVKYTPQWNGGVEVTEPNLLKAQLDRIEAGIVAGVPVRLTEADMDIIATKVAEKLRALRFVAQLPIIEH